MAKITIFEEAIYQYYLQDVDLDNEILKVLNTEETNKRGVIISNVGGFQTNHIRNDLIGNRLLKYVHDFLKEDEKLENVYSLELNGLWINKNLKDHYIMPHTHGHCNLSGVYYVEAPEGCGDLVFLRNDKSCQMSENIRFIKGLQFIPWYDIQPKKGLLVLFSSHQEHMGMPNTSEKARISIAFNIKINTNG